VIKTSWRLRVLFEASKLLAITELSMLNGNRSTDINVLFLGALMGSYIRLFRTITCLARGVLDQHHLFEWEVSLSPDVELLVKGSQVVYILECF
jgi:hypothetical protein